MAGGTPALHRRGMAKRQGSPSLLQEEATQLQPEDEKATLAYVQEHQGEIVDDVTADNHECAAAYQWWGIAVVFVKQCSEYLGWADTVEPADDEHRALVQTVTKHRLSGLCLLYVARRNYKPKSNSVLWTRDQAAEEVDRMGRVAAADAASADDHPKKKKTKKKKKMPDTALVQPSRQNQKGVTQKILRSPFGTAANSARITNLERDQSKVRASQDAVETKVQVLEGRMGALADDTQSQLRQLSAQVGSLQGNQHQQGQQMQAAHQQDKQAISRSSPHTLTTPAHPAHPTSPPCPTQPIQPAPPTDYPHCMNMAHTAHTAVQDLRAFAGSRERERDSRHVRRTRRGGRAEGLHSVFDQGHGFHHLVLLQALVLRLCNSNSTRGRIKMPKLPEAAAARVARECILRGARRRRSTTRRC